MFGDLSFKGSQLVPGRGGLSSLYALCTMHSSIFLRFVRIQRFTKPSLGRLPPFRIHNSELVTFSIALCSTRSPQILSFACGAFRVIVCRWFQRSCFSALIPNNADLLCLRRRRHRPSIKHKHKPFCRVDFARKDL